ncbi:MAG: tetratricopeptide repeat protein [Prochlorococcaceae cyanobacterium]
MAPRSSTTVSSGSSSRGLGRLWLFLAISALLAGAAAGGWWLGQRSQAVQLRERERSRNSLVQQVEQLRPLVSEGEASEQQKQRLLELLVGLERREEATALLEQMADQEPQRWSLRLMLAELRRHQSDRSGAERELRQVLSLQPDRLEALQLMALVQLEQGRGKEAETLLQAALQRANQPQPQPRAVGIGLLLGDLQRRLGQAAQADALYQKLAADFPKDQRPVLARALLKQEQGDSKAALALLAEARQRQPDKPDPRLDEVAAAWGLAPLRRSVTAPSPTTNPAMSPAQQEPTAAPAP